MESLASTLADLDVSRYDSRAIRAHALRFDTHVFMQQMRAFVEQALDAFRKQQPMVWRDPC